MAHRKKEEFKFLLMGKTGSGKSSTGNTILGKDLFTTSSSFNSVTDICELKRAENCGVRIEIMDSPGLFDTGKTPEEVSSVVMQAVAGMHPGPDAILNVLKISRYTEEDHSTYNRLIALLDKGVTRYIITVFTYGDSLKGEAIETLLRNCQPALKQVMTECGHRYVVFDNTENGWKTSAQVKELLKTARQLKQQNGNKPYSCPKYAFVGDKLEEEVKKRLQKVEAEELKNKELVQELTQKLDQNKNDIIKMKKDLKKKEQEGQKALKRKNDEMKKQMNDLSNMSKKQKLSEEAQKKEMKALSDKLNKERDDFMAKLETQRLKRENDLKEKEKEKKELKDSLAEVAKVVAKEVKDVYKEEMDTLRQEIADLRKKLEDKEDKGNGCIVM